AADRLGHRRARLAVAQRVQAVGRLAAVFAGLVVLLLLLLFLAHRHPHGGRDGGNLRDRAPGAGALGDGDDAEPLAAAAALGQGAADAVAVLGDLPDQDDVRPAGEARRTGR